MNIRHWITGIVLLLLVLATALGVFWTRELPQPLVLTFAPSARQMRNVSFPRCDPMHSVLRSFLRMVAQAGFHIIWQARVVENVAQERRRKSAGKLQGAG
jgi:hypothetical protein